MKSCCSNFVVAVNFAVVVVVDFVVAVEQLLMKDSESLSIE